MVDQLNIAGVNEDLTAQAIERKITEQQPLLDLIQQIHSLCDEKIVTQTSSVGHNINSNGGGNISVGGIAINKNDK